MIFAKYVKSNRTFGEEEGLIRGCIYQVRRINKENYQVYLKGFNKSYNRKCFEFYEGKKINIKFD